jgi:hypothetical protein
MPQPCPEIAPHDYHHRIEHPSEFSPRTNCLLKVASFPRIEGRLFESRNDEVHVKINREKMKGYIKANRKGGGHEADKQRKDEVFEEET